MIPLVSRVYCRSPCVLPRTTYLLSLLTLDPPSVPLPPRPSTHAGSARDGRDRSGMSVYDDQKKNVLDLTQGTPRGGVG